MSVNAVTAMPVVELEGTPGQIGEGHGESLRDLVRSHAERHYEWLMAQAALSLTEESLQALWAPRRTANEAAAPELVEEMRGIARGAGVPFERVFLLNSMLDVGNLRHPGCVGGMMGCTTFALPEEAGSGMPVVGQTYDL